MPWPPMVDVSRENKACCAGWIGRLFGHSFQEFTLEEVVRVNPSVIAALRDSDERSIPILALKLENISQQDRAVKYSVRCKRCGSAPDVDPK